MALLVRIYYHAVLGGLGGLLGWVLYCIFFDQRPSDVAWWWIGGALVGGHIGYFVVGVEALRDRSLIRFCRVGTFGALLGATGGAVGLFVAEKVNASFIEPLGPPGGWKTGHVLGFLLVRGLSLLALGAAIGLGEGLAARSVRKLLYGTVGGALGGFVGGALFGLFYYLGEIQSETAERTLSGPIFSALGLIILGACIGAFSALVQGLLQPACVRVLRGWQEGREFALLRSDTLFGREEHADVALFRDMKVEKRHALIQREKERYILVNVGAPAEQTRVNDEPVANCRDLADGDRIQLGGVVLRFQLRAARNRPPRTS